MGLKEFLVKHFRTMINAAHALDVSYRTVRNWCDGNPAGILRHLPTLVKEYDIPAEEVVDVVMGEVDAMDVGIER
jgi:hypothetical protein